MSRHLGEVWRQSGRRPKGASPPTRFWIEGWTATGNAGAEGRRASWHTMIHMPNIPDLEMKLDAGGVKFMTLKYFESRIGKALAADDLDFLEKAMEQYAARLCNEHMREKGILPPEED
jgi:hypothetical protein